MSRKKSPSVIFMITMTVKSCIPFARKVSKSKLKNSLNRLLDNWVSDGQKVLCHTNQTDMSARIIIIHDGVKLTLRFEEDK
ncbi:hypothetical protein [Proteiniphilum acetatigenes]|uniref:hypothetical protein n=1 Tax=Proteiniphilum acetatigenes TaxID=294710 RepID=UPI0012F9697D|nr:hypothetical protein [Proteiniphilum acetatigenes]